MATKPWILNDWPWTPLGNFKYLVLAPWAIHYTYSYLAKEEKRSMSMFLILPFLLSRMLHNQIWISYSRYRTAKGTTRIVDKGIEFDQVDRERNWDDNIIFNGLIYYVIGYLVENTELPLWRTDGVIITILLHAGPVEFLYYWLHRALHHHFLYSRYHSHHHASIVTEPITSVIHPFGEHIAYFLLFAIPQATTFFSGTASFVSFLGYITYVDFMNNMGHCNFEIIPTDLFTAFPPLKYLMYTPSFHSLHHTQFRTNYSLFMPMYDYIYNTMDVSTDELHESSLHRKEDSPDVVLLTHLTTPQSIYHLRLGFASLASSPEEFKSTWYLWFMWPLTVWSMMVTRIYGRAFLVERNIFNSLKLQTWAVPKYSIQYFMQWQRESINSLIEEAILKAEEKGTKVLSLGLLNQEEQLNGNGELYIRRHPMLKLKVVDGSSLAVAIVLNSIPKGTTQVVLRGNLSKIAYSIALFMCQRGVKVITLYEDEYLKLKGKLSSEDATNLVLSKAYAPKVWIVGDGFSADDQMKAPKGTTFIPFSFVPPKRIRKDCFFSLTPAMQAPKSLQNVDSCENWLPRRVMSASRVAGIVHALEKWGVNECGNMMFDVDKIWEASLHHGFRPVTMS